MIRVFPDLDTLSLSAAELFVKQAQQSLAKGRFSIALSGGATPRQTYELLARSPLMDQIPWNIVHFFWGDDRWVPSSDTCSNEGLARQALLDHIPVPEDQIHPIYRPDITAQEAAIDYDRYLRDFFSGERQLFDLVFLGLGENGHTASLFPHMPVLRDERWVGQTHLPGQNLCRVTLTAEAINRSVLVVFLVCGSEKAAILHQVLEGPCQPEEWPAQLIQPEPGKLIWFVDKSATEQLTDPARHQSSMVGR